MHEVDGEEAVVGPEVDVAGVEAGRGVEPLVARKRTVDGKVYAVLYRKQYLLPVVDERQLLGDVVFEEACCAFSKLSSTR